MSILRATSLICLAAVLAATTLVAQQPPQNLHLVGDHWTAWDPPASHPEGTEIHRVERGDTLWDLAARFYGNPYLWPQIWERNGYVLDAHWIYPGDPLAVGFEVTPVEDLAAQTAAASQMADAAAAEAAAAEGAAGVIGVNRSLGPPVALGSEDDIHCTGFIGGLDEDFDRQIVGSEYENLAPRRPGSAGVVGNYGVVDTVKYELTTGDIVYLDGGARVGLLPGDLFTVISPRDRVVHPVSGDTMGRYYRYQGRVRVLSAQSETAIGEIVHSCHPINVGSMLRPFEPQPVPLARRPLFRGINDPAPADQLAMAPTIVRSGDGAITMGQAHVVFIDRGEVDDITPGDIFIIYRLNRRGLPAVVLGELGILAVHERTSVGRILESRHSIHVGDRLDLATP